VACEIFGKRREIDGRRASTGADDYDRIGALVACDGRIRDAMRADQRQVAGDKPHYAAGTKRCLPIRKNVRSGPVGRARRCRIPNPCHDLAAHLRIGRQFIDLRWVSPEIIRTPDGEGSGGIRQGQGRTMLMANQEEKNRQGDNRQNDEQGESFGQPSQNPCRGRHGRMIRHQSLQCKVLCMGSSSTSEAHREGRFERRSDSGIAKMREK
jgi:hypothetical protein